MKILVFTETYLPTVNGVVNSIELFRHELEKRGHQVFIIAPHSSKESFKSRPHVFRLLTIPLIGQPSHGVVWPYLSQVKSIVEEIKPDVIHVQGMFSCGWLGRQIALKEEIPHVLTYHTHLGGYAHYAGILSAPVVPILKWWTRVMANRFDVVITPSPSVGKLLKSYGVKSDIVALPTGIDIKPYHALDVKKIRKELGFDENKLYLLYVGRLAEEKNVPQLLNDFGRLHVRQPNAHLLLAGDGPDKQAYEAIAETRGLGDHVTFLGAVQHEKLIPYYSACDIFCFPSLTDTQGIVLIEAMAAGIPCVVYNMLGPGDIIKNEDSGFAAKPGTDQFFQYMLKLVQDKNLREKLGIGALREARKYSIEKTTDQLEQLYQVLVKKEEDRSL